MRDPVQWHRSYTRTIFMAYRQDLFSRLLVPAMQLPLRALDRRFGAFNEIFDGVFRRHFGDGPIQDEIRRRGLRQARPRRPGMRSG
ncbi:hypothetical protein V2I01_42620 [Micromonospora sp. BRA006-A]|nr:hypothetical protein [Micromonospora sp. BRA006-A]